MMTSLCLVGKVRNQAFFKFMSMNILKSVIQQEFLSDLPYQTTAVETYTVRAKQLSFWGSLKHFNTD